MGKEVCQDGRCLMAGTDPTGDGRVIPGYADRHSLELLKEAGFSFPGSRQNLLPECGDISGHRERNRHCCCW